MNETNTRNPVDFDYDPTDATVLNDVIETWQELDRTDPNGTTFPSALKTHRDELQALLADANTAPSLSASIRNELAIIDGWLAEFAEMHQQLTAV
jgi:hypothetical protein